MSHRIDLIPILCNFNQRKRIVVIDYQAASINRCWCHIIWVINRGRAGRRSYTGRGANFLGVVDSASTTLIDDVFGGRTVAADALDADIVLILFVLDIVLIVTPNTVDHNVVDAYITMANVALLRTILQVYKLDQSDKVTI